MWDQVLAAGGDDGEVDGGGGGGAAPDARNVEDVGQADDNKLNPNQHFRLLCKTCDLAWVGL